MVTNIIHYFYPDLKKDEIKKFSLLSGIFFLIIGAYWLLRLLKNTIFLKIAFPECLGWATEQGCLFQPVAKFWSPFVVLLMVLIYSKLVDIVKKHQLFYIICTFYTILFAIVAGLLFIKDLYGAEYVGKMALAAIGWITYFGIESFGSLVVALFWSFTNSITNSDSAKRGYPFIAAVAQLSAILGSSMLFFSAYIGSVWPILLLASVLVAMVIPLVSYFLKAVPSEQLVGNVEAAQTEKKKEGFIEGFLSGLVLLFSRPYLLGVLIISTLYEAVAQIVEYQMQVFASMSPQYTSEIAFAQFQSLYGVSVNFISFLVALLGTRYIIKNFGIRISLLIFPVVFGGVLLSLFSYFILMKPDTVYLLWATFAAMVVIKGVGYAVNNPTKEIMYIPTSKDAKFKSKGWIDTFGSRFSKAGGAQVTNAFKYNMADLMIYGSIFGFGFIGIWIVAALFVGSKNKQLIQDKEIIE
ncbi:MAG: Npt1/Npt2 family nucleotide transporter [Candidatus Babeliales bacterium]